MTARVPEYAGYTIEHVPTYYVSDAGELRPYENHGLPGDELLCKYSDVRAFIDQHTASPPPTDDIVAGLREMHEFLRGAGTLRGCSFGEKPVGAKGNYWWREPLADVMDRAIAALGEKGWQQIETAPESGWMLVSYLYHGKRCGNPEIKQRYLREFVWPSNSYEVTHWQSIPAPPVAGGK